MYCGASGGACSGWGWGSSKRSLLTTSCWIATWSSAATSASPSTSPSSSWSGSAHWWATHSISPGFLLDTFAPSFRAKIMYQMNRPGSILCTAALVVCVFVQATVGQQEAGGTQTEEVVRVNAELVQTGVSVFDKQGRFVEGVK